MPSPLASLFSTIDSYKRRGADLVKSLADNPLLAAQLQATDVANASKDRAAQLDSLYRDDKGLLTFDPAKWSPKSRASHDAITQDALGAIAGATVYHGTPHTFDKFMASKMGTGEGNATYGRGLYFAENPAVAQQYARELPIIEGLSPKLGPEAAADARRLLAAREADPKAFAQYLDGGQSYLGKIAQGIERGKIKQQPGNVLSVDLPDEKIARMVDWDKPLAEQPANVREAWAGIMRDWGKPENFTSGRAGAGVGNTITAAQMESALQARGVPGIKYRDQLSRTPMTEPRPMAGSGTWSMMDNGKLRTFPDEASARAAYTPPTSNFVVFPGEEDALKILTRNGKSLLDYAP